MVILFLRQRSLVGPFTARSGVPVFLDWYSFEARGALRCVRIAAEFEWQSW
jgi:hypothetical protein